MCRSQTELVVISYNAAISAREKGQQRKQALNSCRSILRSPSVHGVLCYNSTIRVCEKATMWAGLVVVEDKVALPDGA